MIASYVAELYWLQNTVARKETAVFLTYEYEGKHIHNSSSLSHNWKTYSGHIFHRSAVLDS